MVMFTSRRSEWVSLLYHISEKRFELYGMPTRKHRRGTESEMLEGSLCRLAAYDDQTAETFKNIRD